MYDICLSLVLPFFCSFDLYTSSIFDSVWFFNNIVQLSQDISIDLLFSLYAWIFYFASWRFCVNVLHSHKNWFNQKAVKLRIETRPIDNAHILCFHPFLCFYNKNKHITSPLIGYWIGLSFFHLIPLLFMVCLLSSSFCSCILTKTWCFKPYHCNIIRFKTINLMYFCFCTALCICDCFPYLWLQVFHFYPIAVPPQFMFLLYSLPRSSSHEGPRDVLSRWK